MTSPVGRVVEVNAIAFTRIWKGSVFTTIVSPVLFLAAMGVGLGGLVDDGTGTDGLRGASYLDFLAPGLLAAAAMQAAAGEATYPIMAGFKWQKHYTAMLHTPLQAGDVAIGTLLWIGIRVAMTAAAFVAVMVVFGAAASPLVVLAVPVAVLVGVAFAGPIIAYVAGVENEYALSNLLRFGVVPLFLFSGTFFPVSELPGWLEPVAWVVPLWHGVELCRDLALGDVDALAAVGHLAYLTLWTVVGALLAVRRFTRRLVV